MDSMDFPSIGLTALRQRKGKEIGHHISLPNPKYVVLKTSAARHDKTQSAHMKKGYALDLLKHTCRRQTLARSHFSKLIITEAGCLLTLLFPTSL